MGDGIGCAIVIRHGQGNRVGARSGISVSVARGRYGVAAAITKAPGIRDDAAVAVTGPVAKGAFQVGAAGAELRRIPGWCSWS
jgi:hypothetical protein